MGIITPQDVSGGKTTCRSTGFLMQDKIKTNNNPQFVPSLQKYENDEVKVALSMWLVIKHSKHWSR